MRDANNRVLSSFIKTSPCQGNLLQDTSQMAFTCPKSATETTEPYVGFVQT